MAAVAVFALALSRFLRSREPCSLFVALAAIAHAARTLLFSLANYSRLSGLDFLPAEFEETHVSGIVYLILVSVAAYSAFGAMTGAADTRPPARLSRDFAAFYALAIAAATLAAILPVRLDEPELLSLFGILYDFPFAVAKAFLIASAIFFLVRPGKIQRPLERWSLAALALSQVLDLSLRFWPEKGASIEYTFLAYQLSFAASLFLLLLRRAEAAPESPVDVFRERFNLGEEELALLAAVIAGRSNKEIAFDRGLSLGAVKGRLFTLYRRIGVASRYELMAEAARSGEKEQAAHGGRRSGT